MQVRARAAVLAWYIGLTLREIWPLLVVMFVVGFALGFAPSCAPVQP